MMKAKTARRRLRRNEWKMARAEACCGLSSIRGIGKQWKNWTRAALAIPSRRSLMNIPSKAKIQAHARKVVKNDVQAMIRKMMEIRSPEAVKPLKEGE